MTHRQTRFEEQRLPGFEFDPGAGSTPVVPRLDRLVEDHRKFHRQRLRQRFTQGGAAAVPDYELLEMLLYRAIRRGDTKPLAKDPMSVENNRVEIILLRRP